MERERLLKEEFNKKGFEPDENQVDQFIEFYEMLVDWNSRMNLTGITEFEDVIVKHYVDSLMLGSLFRDAVKPGSKIIDIGTGAGFPGIPIKIMYPEVNCVLLDSLQKRIGFLNAVIEELGLTEITAVHGRAEEFVSDGYREKFDICISRAVADLSILSELCMPYVKPGGYFISYKSGKCREELEQAGNALKILGGSVIDIKEFKLNIDNDGRSLIIIKKIESTPDKYPRRMARIMKNPL